MTAKKVDDAQTIIKAGLSLTVPPPRTRKRSSGSGATKNHVSKKTKGGEPSGATRARNSDNVGVADEGYEPDSAAVADLSVCEPNTGKGKEILAAKTVPKAVSTSGAGVSRSRRRRLTVAEAMLYIEGLPHLLSSLNAKNIELSKKLESKNLRIQNLVTQVGDKESQLIELKEEHTKIVEDLKKVASAEKDELKSEMSELKLRFETEIQELKDTVEKRTLENVDQLSKNAAGFKDRYEEVSADLDEAETKCKILTKKLADFVEVSESETEEGEIEGEESLDGKEASLDLKIPVLDEDLAWVDDPKDKTLEGDLTLNEPSFDDTVDKDGLDIIVAEAIGNKEGPAEPSASHAPVSGETLEV